MCWIVFKIMVESIMMHKTHGRVEASRSNFYFYQNQFYNNQLCKINCVTINPNTHEEVEGDLSMLPSPPQHHIYSPNTTPICIISLVNINETYNIVILKLKCYKRHQSKKYIWFKAMQEEIKMIKKNNTWKLIECPQGKRVT